MLPRLWPWYYGIQAELVLQWFFPHTVAPACSHGAAIAHELATLSGTEVYTNMPPEASSHFYKSGDLLGLRVAGGTGNFQMRLRTGSQQWLEKWHRAFWGVSGVGCTKHRQGDTCVPQVPVEDYFVCMWWIQVVSIFLAKHFFFLNLLQQASF